MRKMRIPQVVTLIQKNSGFWCKRRDVFLTGVGQQGKSVEGCAWRKEGTDKKRIRWKSFDNHLIHQSGRRDSNPRPSAWKANALSTELLPQSQWARMDSNHRRHKPADLQSAPFGHSGNFPYVSKPLSLTPPCRLRKVFLEPMEGFEPPTSWLQISCSGQLSYIGI